MRLRLLAGLSAAALVVSAVPGLAAKAPATGAGPVPLGRLPDAAKPLAYRLNLTVLPDQSRFSGHAEIDVDLKAPTRSLYLHGRDLDVRRATARTRAGDVSAAYTQVDRFGVARLNFKRTLPAGKTTLVFDYDAPFGSGPAGLYHLKVGDAWYAWTQFESIDARAAFPGFDQPGYKTPFTVSLTTRPGFATVSNAPETKETPVAGGLVRHQFAPTLPLPTYLVAMMVGPFATASSAVPPTPERAQPLPIRVVATQPNKDKLDFALQNTGPIVSLLERYFGRPFPFPKLDQIGSPVMPGAMENAGADTYGDDILMLDKGASTAQKQAFGMVVAHELSHQWFGDLVTPAWWDDIWLNESFANWMGYRIGNEWRPDLKIGAGAIEEALAAMDIDALQAGRPIHQHIRTNGEIDSAFDAVTYGKGGQVVAMIAVYLGDEKFREGVRLHINRHAYGNATTEDFFAALAEAGHDPRVVTAMKSFVDQQGVPVVRVERTPEGLAISQKRYAMLGSELTPETWTIPFCVRVGGTRQCVMLDKASAVVPMTATGPIVPNAGGAGYYRFSLPEPAWRVLIGEAASLPPGEALAVTDSLWAAFRAGEVSPQLLVEAARKMAANPYSEAATGGGRRLAGLRANGMIPAAALPAYRSLIGSIYGPRLAELGFDPRAGVYAAEDPDRQKLRTQVVGLMANEAQDEAVRGKLAAAAQAYLGGDKTALDQSLLADGFAAWLAVDGEAKASSLFDRAAASDDSLFRRSALQALSRGGDEARGRWLIAHLNDPRLTSQDRLALLHGLAGEPATRALVFEWLKANYEAFAKDAGIFESSGLPGLPAGFCSVDKAHEIDAALRPVVKRLRQGELTLDRTVERVRDCGVLEQARGPDLAAAITAGAR